MRPETTYELVITLKEKSQDLILDIKEELHKLNVFAYSEGSIDDLDQIDNEECEKKKEELLEDCYLCDTITLNGYEKKSLLHYESVLLDRFKEKISTKFSSFTTASWLEAWKDSFKPIETKSFRVCPPWERDESSSKKEVIIEPALAFGTGQHETTQICLKLIESYLEKNSPSSKKQIMDLGTGSGILAIAAVKEGLTNLVALDIDDDSVAAAKSNAKMNAVSFEVYKSDLESFLKEKEAQNYDLIIANILLPVLQKTVPAMSGITSQGSELILSGLITEQKDEMLKVASESGFELLEELTQGDWLGLRVRKK